ncbi:hypothetical protein WJX72_000594 [[Myrmecia] bisecta]|uniref:Rhodanese domain-containing protein n=1 Tax=[Myrmecia] bisecta TaxID=41462 RepID=A0AAW1R432_9CHLO
MQALCEQLQLRGRVRVAADGINVTLGGTMDHLNQHIAAVRAHPLLGSKATDFKLAPSAGPLSSQALRESGFDSLSVTLCKEVVTMGSSTAKIPPDKLPDVTARHVAPSEFHALLHGDAPTDKPTVLLDARNMYETRIGHFEVPGVPLLDPKLRCFSDLPSWIDSNEAALRDKRVLMYCTGGVRCERASAYLRSKGEAFRDVVQLQGGIQRYLEAFPDGGYFRGKNFVFDERVSVGSSSEDVVGQCLVCQASCDDYGPRLRCHHCRLLVLVCATCREQGDDNTGYTCELCVASRPAVAAARAPAAGSSPAAQPRRLRILCLHGFRQTGSSFKGRTAALAKKLRDIAELVAGGLCRTNCQHSQGEGQSPTKAQLEPHDDMAARILKLPRTAQPRHAWLVSPDELRPADSGNTEAQWVPAPTTADEQQHLRQTAGWARSVEHLQAVLRGQGPFDGVLGFSQGAGVAAMLIALQQQQQRKEQVLGTVQGTSFLPAKRKSPNIGAF